MKLPLELKLIIYEYFDPKDELASVEKYYSFFNRKYYETHIYIESEKAEGIKLNNNAIVYFRYKDETHFSENLFFLRKSQVLDCYKRLK